MEEPTFFIYLQCGVVMEPTFFIYVQWYGVEEPMFFNLQCGVAMKPTFFIALLCGVMEEPSLYLSPVWCYGRTHIFFFSVEQHTFFITRVMLWKKPQSIYLQYGFVEEPSLYL